MHALAILFIALLWSSVAHAEQGLTRRDGFLLIWESIRRPAAEVREQPFQDVRENSVGFLEITYAKNRGVLDDNRFFHPDDLLTRDEALLWIFRTRNLRELPHMQRRDLEALTQRYPIAELNPIALVESQSELFDLMHALDRMLEQEEHEVSLYAEDFHGRGTAFGETFDMNALTAAHRSFPQNTLVEVTNVENGKQVVVRVNDRGPYVLGRDMDLSLAAFETIADRSQGVINARFKRLGDLDLVDQCSDQPRRFQKRITRDVRFHRGVPHTWNTGEALWLGSTSWFVVRSIRHPDGRLERIQEFINPKERERFSFTPRQPGQYVLLVGTKEGRRREFRMTVQQCNKVTM